MKILPPSIRTRLPLSYAGIALLATLALGAVLLLILQQFYRQQELDYLTGNARAISAEVATLLETDIPAEVLQAQLQGFAFLSQTRVRLLNLERETIVDSGSLTSGERFITLSVDIGTQIEEEALNFRRESTETVGENRVESRIVVSNGLFSQNVEETVILEDGNDVVSALTTNNTPYGFGLNQEFDRGIRSTQSVRYPVVTPFGDLLGYVELSEGPAYGRDILTSVALAWAGSSVVAMAVAAVVGWFASRRLTRPLLALTDTTTQMSHGNLAARTNIKRQDELGTLAHSFNQMADQLEETILTLRRFVADAAHELNTPLTALRTNLELAAGSQPTEHLAQAQTQLQRLEQLTAGLLNLSTLESQPQTTADHHSLNLNQLVEESSELFASQAEQKEITFELQLPQDTIMVQGNTAALRQAIDNLLENALKFTDPHGRVTVSLTAAGSHARLDICDTGIGIPAEDVPRLFGRFFRGHNTASYPGSGLGLAIVQTIVQQHGGEIAVRPLEKGTCVNLQLPTCFP